MQVHIKASFDASPSAAQLRWIRLVTEEPVPLREIGKCSVNMKTIMRLMSNTPTQNWKRKEEE